MCCYYAHFASEESYVELYTSSKIIQLARGGDIWQRLKTIVIVLPRRVLLASKGKD